MPNTELPEHILKYILERHLRSYLFNNHNKAPDKITVPRITSVSIYVGRDEQLTVPVEFEKEESSGASGEQPKKQRSSRSS